MSRRRASPTPTELLAEEKLRSAWLRQLLAERDAELAARERAINAAYLDSLASGRRTPASMYRMRDRHRDRLTVP